MAKAQCGQASCEGYGHVATVSSLGLTRLWKPSKAPRRGVWAITSRGPMGRMGSARSLAPWMASTLSCARVRMEPMVARLTSVLGAVASRCWSTRLPRHSRTPTKPPTLTTPPQEHRETGQQTWQACERCVLLGCLTCGLLQLVALQVQHQGWEAFRLLLRTRRRAVPAERTVKEVVAQALGRHARKVAAAATMPFMAPGECPEEPWTHSTLAEELFMGVDA